MRAARAPPGRAVRARCPCAPPMRAAMNCGGEAGGGLSISGSWLPAPRRGFRCSPGAGRLRADLLTWTTWGHCPPRQVPRAPAPGSGDDAARGPLPPGGSARPMPAWRTTARATQECTRRSEVGPVRMRFVGAKALRGRGGCGSPGAGLSADDALADRAEDEHGKADEAVALREGSSTSSRVIAGDTSRPGDRRRSTGCENSRPTSVPAGTRSRMTILPGHRQLRAPASDHSDRDRSSRRSRWQQLTGGGSNVRRVIREAGAFGIDVHVIARRELPAADALEASAGGS